jgi:hypothetical protein
MSIWLMSSNGFLREIKLLSLPAFNGWYTGRFLRRFQLSVNSNGAWSLWDEASSRPVLLLRHRSLWVTSFAAISLQQADSSVVVLYFWRKDQKPWVWRRARVHFAHGV